MFKGHRGTKRLSQIKIYLGEENKIMKHLSVNTYQYISSIHTHLINRSYSPLHQSYRPPHSEQICQKSYQHIGGKWLIHGPNTARTTSHKAWNINSRFKQVVILHVELPYTLILQHTCKQICSLTPFSTVYSIENIFHLPRKAYMCYQVSKPCILLTKCLVCYHTLKIQIYFRFCYRYKYIWDVWYGINAPIKSVGLLWSVHCSAVECNIPLL